MPEPIVIVEDLKVYFYTYAGVVRAVDGVSFEIYEGETFCIVGETGCGKSVTSRALTKLIDPPGRIAGGKVLFKDRSGRYINMLELDEETLREMRGKEIAYIFQDPAAALDPLYTIGYHFIETMRDHGTIRSNKEGIERAIELLREVAMPAPEVRVKNYPHELSGGMKQRAVIGIGLSNMPRLLIADEPTSYLDVSVQAQILELLRQLKEKRGLTLLMITHDMGVVAEMCDRVAVLYAGHLAEIGPVDRIFMNPLHPYTQALLRAVPNPTRRMLKLEPIPGNVPNLASPPPGCRFHPRCPYAMDICKRERPKMIEVEERHRVACWLYAKR
ncbi:MAG: ABC transporter ATP-binding protein [Crenarchaeota archaeon]|nr:ABC transporter ATP-binding protein [Thermoproteota archaeon]